MSNDVPTPKMLLSVFTDTINYLIENHKYQEAYEQSLFSLDRIIILITISVLTFENIILRKGEIIKTCGTTANKACLGTNYLLKRK
jgi:hypothetical protein